MVRMVEVVVEDMRGGRSSGLGIKLCGFWFGSCYFYFFCLLFVNKLFVFYGSIVLFIVGLDNFYYNFKFLNKKVILLLIMSILFKEM